MTPLGFLQQTEVKTRNSSMNDTCELGSVMWGHHLGQIVAVRVDVAKTIVSLKIVFGF